MELTLAPNPLHDQTQTLHIDKVATLIGENGSGKSSILHSIFEKQAEKNDDDIRLICATSGQNENFSTFFEKKLTSLRSSSNLSDINYSCLYFSAKDARLLTFLAFTFKANGLVHNFLTSHRHLKDNLSLNLGIRITVPDDYIKRVQQDLASEAKDFEHPSIRKRPFNLRLEQLLESIDELPNLETLIESGKGFKQTAVTISSDSLFNIFNGAREQATKFLIEGSYNEYFFSAKSMQLQLTESIEFSNLSDGEYQYLFISALVDLFDHESSLFMLDEVDSHLHFKNVERLWRILESVEGKVITTTHLLDSITENNFESLFVVEKGRINNEYKSQKVLERLKVLTKSKVVELEVASKLQNICLIDYYNDWLIFELLAKQKGLNWESLSIINPIAKSSGYSAAGDIFGAAKISWVEELKEMKEHIRTCAAEVHGKIALHPPKSTNLFLICDRDELPDANIDATSGVKVKVRHKIPNVKIGIPRPENVNIFMLVWKRREIKNYLLSFTALTAKGVINQINNDAILRRDNFLQPNVPGDNEDIQKSSIKSVIDPLVNTECFGLDIEKLQAYIDLIPPEEISEDITNMYNFIIGKL
jgi:ABC-type cobalamin/Fe3+-siderophores transport system ATPase subunit